MPFEGSTWWPHVHGDSVNSWYRIWLDLMTLGAPCECRTKSQGPVASSTMQEKLTQKKKQEGVETRRDYERQAAGAAIRGFSSSNTY